MVMMRSWGIVAMHRSPTAATARNRLDTASHALALMALIALTSGAIHAATMWCNRGSLFPPSGKGLVVIDKYDHPHADLAVAA